MDSGLAFDPAEFSAFKAGQSRPTAPTFDTAPPAASTGFDPAEFASFKQRRQEPEASAPASFDERFGSGPMSRATDASSDPLAQGLRRAADERLVGKPNAATSAMAFALRGGNAAGLNLPRNIGAGLASVPGIGNGRSFTENYQLAKDQEEALARQAPKSALAGTATGIVSGAMVLPAVRAAEGAGMVGRGIANAATGFGYGAAAEYADTKDIASAGGAGAIGGAFGVAGGAVLDGGARIYSAFRRANVPFRDASGALTERAATALREAGIDPAAVTPDIEAAFAAKGPSAAVAREAAASEFAIPLSTGQATLDPAALRLEGASLSGGRGPRARDIGQDFETRQAGAIDAARGRLNAMAARGGPVIDNPASAFEAVADRAQMVGRGYADDVARAENAQREALTAIRGSGPADVLDGATTAVQGVRDAAERARAAYGDAYDVVDALEGTFAPDAFARAGQRVRGMLGPEMPIAAEVTPAAARALSLIDDMPAMLGLRPGEGPTAQQVGLIRKGISNLYGATGQNGTDRAALGAVREAFDRHVQDMAEIGQFRPGRAPRSPAPGAASADDAASRAIEVPADAIPVPEPRQGEPETLLRYLARNGGIPLDDEARSADLNRLYMPGAGTLARRNAPTWDQLRVRMAEQGFFSGDDMAGASPRDVADRVRELIRRERQGDPTSRMSDEAHGGARRAADRVADENADHAAAVDREARRLAIDLEGYGITGSSLDRAALREAAEAGVLGRADDGVSAYDDVLARRDAAAADGPPIDVAPDAPFPGLGEGVGPAGDGFPAGDSGPADAMRKARGLFSEYKRAFTPRGAGDVAGQRLQKIVERDASPNEAVAMLFGTTTGRVSAGQLQTLARLREAVGADSEPWRAVQQSLIARYVAGEGRDLGARLDYLLRGEGRQLASSFLTAEQRTGLGQLRAAIYQTERAHQAVPEWLQNVERGGFDPVRIASSLFGSGVPGARPGALNEVRAAKALLGAGSAEWSMLRQAAVQRLTGDPSANARKAVEAIRGFTEGAGAGVAKELFDAAELGQLRRFASVINSTLRPDGYAKADPSAAAGAAAKALDVLAGIVAFKAGGPAAGGAAYGAKVGQRALIGGLGARSARRSFEGGAPRERLPVPYLPTGQLSVGSGLFSGQR